MLENTTYSHVLILGVGVALVVLALVATWRSRAISTTGKIIWTLMLVLLPLIGLIVWALAWFTGGSKAARQARL